MPNATVIGGSPAGPDTPEGDYVYDDVMQAELDFGADGSLFGNALAHVLQGALPIVRSGLDLVRWLHMLAEENTAINATAAAVLYLRISRGWQILPQGTKMELQWTRNYASATDVERTAFVNTELSRLQSDGFLLTLEQAQLLFPSLRGLDRPNVVNAMGCVLKVSAGALKTRLVLDCSAPHGRSLNDIMDIPPTRLASVQQARAGLASMGQHPHPTVHQFKLDLKDAFLQNPNSAQSTALLGIEWQGQLYVYRCMPFGAASAPAAQQTLSCALARGVLRRWERAGLVVGPAPGYDHYQEWPSGFRRSRPRDGEAAATAGVSWALSLVSDSAVMDSLDRSAVPQSSEAAFSVFSRLRALGCSPADAASRVHHRSTLQRALRHECGESHESRDPEPHLEPASSPPCYRVNGYTSTVSTEESPHNSSSRQRAASLVHASRRPVDAQLFTYLDDFKAQILGPKQKATMAYELFIELCAELGIVVQLNPLKTIPPDKVVEFLGIIFDASSPNPLDWHLRLDEARVSRMIDTLINLEERTSVSLNELQSLIGVLQFAAVVLPAAVPYYRRLLDAKRGLGARPSPGIRIAISDGMREDSRMWRTLLQSFNGRPISAGMTQLVCPVKLYTDSSFLGGGYFFGGRHHMWRWPKHWDARFGQDGDWEVSIVEAELWAVLFGLRDVVPLVANQVLTVMIDNTSVVGMCRRQSAKCGAHRSPRCIPLMREIALLCAAFGVTIRALPISTDDNTMADLLSRARAPDVTPELLHATLREWSAREPDTTHWRPQPATHAFLVPLIERATLD